MTNDDDQQHAPHANDVWINAVLVGRMFYKEAGAPPSNLPVPIDFLRPHVERLVAQTKKIERHDIVIGRGHYPSIAVRSTLVPTRDRSVILLHAGLNFCYRRFAAAVEFAHLLLGQNKAYRTTDIIEHLAGLLAGFPATPNTSLYAEATAPLIAIELLMPMAFSAKMDEYVAARASSMEVATAFRVPLFVADWSMAGGWRYRATLHREIKDPPPVPPAR